MSTTLQRVSVVIPTYNYGHFVTEAVQSALTQTYPNLEVIVVDDGSNDDTAERLRQFGNQIIYIYQQNRGLSSARNAGIRRATGEWVAFLDADDVWHAEKIAKQLAAVGGDHDIGLIGSLPAAVLPDKLPGMPPVRNLGVRDFLTSSRTGPSGTLIRRGCFNVVGFFDEELTSIEDRDMWLRVAAKFRSVQVVSPCWWYRPHQGQMSRRAGRMLENYKKVLTKFFTQHNEYASLRRLAWSYMYLDGCWAFLDEKDMRTARSLMVRSVCLMPWSFRDSHLRRFPRARIIARLCVGDDVFGKIRALRSRG
jgi:glycosyltransferase involved in cell wall biosynthesis